MVPLLAAWHLAARDGLVSYVISGLSNSPLRNPLIGVAIGLMILLVVFVVFPWWQGQQINDCLGGCMCPNSGCPADWYNQWPYSGTMPPL